MRMGGRKTSRLEGLYFCFYDLDPSCTLFLVGYSLQAGQSGKYNIEENRTYLFQ